MPKTLNKKNPYLITKKDYLMGWLYVLPRRRKLRKAVEINLNRKPEDKDSIGVWTEKFVEKHPEKIAILYEDSKYTFKEYNEWINRYANYFLNNVGLRKGDVAIVFMENRPELLFIIVAMAKIGVISSLINTNQRQDPLAHSITHTPGKVFIIGEELIDAFEEVKLNLELTEDQRKNLYFIPDKGKKSPSDGFINLFEEVKNENIENPPTSAEIEARDPYAYIFTSGTTGLPKAAIITNGHTVGAAYYWGDICIGMKKKDIMYITTPLFHSNAINVAYAAALRYGSTMAIRRKFSVSNFWKDTRKFKATCFNYIGEICRYLFNQPPKKDDKKNPVKKIVGNGLRPDIWKYFKKRFGIKRICEFYGATERFNPNFANIFNRDCTVGICIGPYAIVKYDIDADETIRDENGFLIRAEPGEAGLLLGQVDPTTFYMYKDKKADEKKIFRNVFEEGDMYLNTGDLLRDIGYGHTQFVDRLGDTFRWKGENVSTEEVETVINNFKQVEMCAVYGVLIPNTEGRAGMASIVIGDSDIEKFKLSKFLSYLQEYLPEYAVPKFIRFRKEIETTATLKIQKIDMKKEGFDPNKIEDPLFMLLPGTSEYAELTKEIFDGINNGKYRF